MVLVALSVVEQRLDAVRAVLAGASVTEVAAAVGVSRVSVHAWLRRYLAQGLPGLADRSRRPQVSPRKIDVAVEVVLVEMRRQHPRWGAKRIRMELLRAVPSGWVEGVPVPSTPTINRVLTRRGLVRSRPRKRPRDSFVRWERPAAMQLWGMDIVGGLWLVDPTTGVLREAKVVTAVDDHSRFCVIATVVEHATGRAVCLALAQALARFGVPEELLTDNGKQFTDRFGGHGEVLFDRICRLNGITHRLTHPASPNENGKVERFHGTFRPDFLDQVDAFTSLDAAQAAVDVWVVDYNTNRPHQGLDDKVPVTPAQRFAPVPADQRGPIGLWLPPTLQAVAPLTDPDPVPAAEDQEPAVVAWSGGAVEVTKPVPASGNMSLAGKQFWLGPQRAGQPVTFWVDVDLIHVFLAGTRIKTVRSHLSVNDLARLVADGALNAGLSPLPKIEEGDAVEVERVVSKDGLVTLGGRMLLAAEILSGRKIGIRIEADTLMFYDLETRELLRTRANPLSFDTILRLRGNRPAGPPPRPSTEPIRVQRRASNTGIVMVCGQKVALGRIHQHQTVTIMVSDTTLAIEFAEGDIRVVRRTTNTPVRNIKADRPRTATSVS